MVLGSDGSKGTDEKWSKSGCILKVEHMNFLKKKMDMGFKKNKSQD